MIIGPTFAIGHIPKTGGDALHAWCDALQDRRLDVDSPLSPLKHLSFADRSDCHGRQRYVLTLRRLPEWTLSYLQETTFHATEQLRWDFQEAGESLRPSAALLQPYADIRLAELRKDWTVTDWLIAGDSLLDQLQRFLEQHYRPLTAEEKAAMSGALVKPPRMYNRDVRSWWTRREIEQIYRLNPTWSAIENMIYGGLL
jgi:hypothetical protein